MGVVHPGARNPNWKGGRSIASNGYVLLRVGAEHHLADVRGYAYEHRVVAEKTIGRRLRKGEQVHHRNHDKQDNRPENLEVCASIAEHRAKHRKSGSNRRATSDNPAVVCACGCGRELSKFDASGRPRRFVNGHNRRKTRDNPVVSCGCGCGARFSKFGDHGWRPRRFVHGHKGKG